MLSFSFKSSKCLLASTKCIIDQFQVNGAASITGPQIKVIMPRRVKDDC